MEDLDLDNLLEEIGDTQEVNMETPKVVEAEPEAEVEVESGVMAASPRMLEAIGESVPDIDEVEVRYSDEFIDIMQETKEYMEKSFEIEAEIRAYKSQLQDLKNEAKEVGVPVTAVGKAIKEMVKEIKETPDESHNIEQMKRFITENESLYSEVSAQAL